jgi:hypothetical protein
MQQGGMHSSCLFIEKALHIEGELRPRILVWPVLRMCRFGHFLLYAITILLAITVILFWHMFINVIYVVDGEDGRIIKWKWE